MRYVLSQVLVLGVGWLGCHAPECDDVAPPYAFHVALHHDGGVRDLDVTVGAESGEHVLTDLDLGNTAGHFVQLDVEWGGAEPDGSEGTFTATGDGLPPIFISLTAEQDDDGCPVTQHARSTMWRPGGE